MNKNTKLDSLFDKSGLPSYEQNQAQETKFTLWITGQEIQQIPIKLLCDFPDTPFPLYTGERKADMVDSIKKYGIIQPLILREKGEKLEILSGHNRKYCALLAKLVSVPAIVKHDMTDEDAYQYVLESNLIQRSFSELKHSEKATILSHEHSKLFSQGKRNDIIRELETLEQTSNPTVPTFDQVGQKLNTHEKISKNYGLSRTNVVRYLRIIHLINPLKRRLDDDELAFTVAVALSFLRKEEQELLEKHIELNNFIITSKKTIKLKDFSKTNQLDEVDIYNILNGEDFRMTEKEKAPDIRIPQKVLIKYFSNAKSKKEIHDTIEKALEFYNSNQTKDKG